jgi:hypothetical protein
MWSINIVNYFDVITLDQTESTSSLFRSPGPARSKTDVQDVSGLCFQRSTYPWKDNLIRKPITLVWGLNFFWVIGKRRISQRPESVSVLRHRFCSVGPCIIVEPVRGGRVQGWWWPLDLYIQPPPLLLRFGFCLDYFAKNSFAVLSVCETPIREINFSSANWLHSFLFLLVFFNSQAKDLAFLERYTAKCRLITRGYVVLRSRGFASYCSEAGSIFCLVSTKSKIIRTF